MGAHFLRDVNLGALEDFDRQPPVSTRLSFAFPRHQLVLYNFKSRRHVGLKLLPILVLEVQVLAHRKDADDRSPVDALLSRNSAG